MKKELSLLLAIVLAASMLTVGTLSASADEAVAGVDEYPWNDETDYESLALGGYGTLGEYRMYDNPNAVTQHLLFAMPGAWQNDTTKDPKCGGVAGIYWWGDIAYDAPDHVAAGGHGWPGYKTKKVSEEGIDNLYEVNVPCYGNGEANDAMTIIWNNFIDAGMEPDITRNPFYTAGAQVANFSSQYYSRNSLKMHPQFEQLFRYIYKSQLENCGVDVASIALTAGNFWEKLNKAAADFNGEDWDSLDEDERTFQIDVVLDEEDLDFSAFGSYASNFFNEDNVGTDGNYPKEEANYDGVSFTFDNMVYVVDLDPAHITINTAMGNRPTFAGDVYFYYGNGEYGTWPTKELTEEQEAAGVVARNYSENNMVIDTIMSDSYWKSGMDDIPLPTIPTEPTNPPTTNSPSTNPATSDSASPTAPRYVFEKRSDGTYAIKDYTGQVANLAIPDCVREKFTGSLPEDYYTQGYATSVSGGTHYVDVPITAIGDWAFSGNKYLKSVVIPDTIQTIGTGAFDGCPQLKHAYMDDGTVTIGKWAFSNCKSLESVMMPDTVTTIGMGVFEGCLSLTDVILSENLEAIPNDAFYDCRSLENIEIPDSVQSIGCEAFYHCRSLNELVIPEGVEMLSVRTPNAPGAFEGCVSLNKVVLPESLTKIAGNTFESCHSLTIYAQRSSAAQTFAEDNSIRFSPIGGVTAWGDIIGDVDGDNAITINDATIVQKYLAEYTDEDGNPPLDINSKERFAAADVNHDGKITIKDVTAIQRYLAEYIASFV